MTDYATLERHAFVKGDTDLADLYAAACPYCGGHNIMAEAVCTWNMAQQIWEYKELTAAFFCTTCEETIKWVDWVQVGPVAEQELV